MLRPDIIWFEDAVDEQVFEAAGKLIAGCELFVAVGTSAVVSPAASFIPLARPAGAFMVEINPEATEASAQFDRCLRAPATATIAAAQIGRASCRARVWQDVELSVGDGPI